MKTIKYFCLALALLATYFTSQALFKEARHQELKSFIWGSTAFTWIPERVHAAYERSEAKSARFQTGLYDITGWVTVTIGFALSLYILKKPNHAFQRIPYSTRLLW